MHLGGKPVRCTSRRTRAVLFDLGNTLVRYFDPHEFPAVLEQAILEVRSYLQGEGLLAVTAEAMWQRVREEDHEAPDHRVRPLAARLVQIFALDPAADAALVEAMCRRFTRPIFARGQRYDDSLRCLRQLRSRGFRTALVSNTPWGSPGGLWRAELERLGLSPWLEATVFCTDVGWRKPARPIFEQALAQLQVEPHDCLFVGDDPRWDLAGPQSLGMEVILIDREGIMPEAMRGSIRNLDELGDRLQV